MENIKIGYVSKLPDHKLEKSGSIKDFNDTSYFLYYKVLRKDIRKNEPIIFTYKENTNKLDRFNKPRLDVIEVLDVDSQEWLDKNKSKISQLELEKIKTYKEKKHLSKDKEDVHSSNNLEIFFEIGTQEEKQSLLHTLESTLANIDSEDKYQQATHLIDISNKNGLDKQFVYKIFIKANIHYRYRLWLENYVNFCNPNYLYRKLLEEKDTEIIKNRLSFNLLDSQNNIEVCFNGIKDKIIENISTATKSLKIAMAWFTNYDIFGKLLELRERNISIDLIIINDLINNGGYCLNFNELIDKGGNIYLSEFPSMMHNKFCLIDDEILINGSYNWTYYAETINEENILIIKDNSIINSFKSEFERLKEEYIKVDQMPDSVPDKPEYDRSAFKHYITRELQIRASNKSGEEKIRLLHQALKITPDFPGNTEIRDKYKEQFSIIDDELIVDQITNSIVSEKECRNIEQIIESTESTISTSSKQLKPQTTKTVESLDNINQKNISTEVQKSQSTPSAAAIVQPQSTNIKSSTISQPTEQSLINKNSANSVGNSPNSVNYTTLICDNIILGIDNSGSMVDYYKSGLINQIINKVISISLRYTKKRDINVWTYNSNPSYTGTFSLANLADLKTVCSNGSTNVANFIQNIQKNLVGKSLVIVLTDGEDNTIKNVVANISNKANSEFWQFIGIGAKFSSFTAALNMDNASFCHFDNIRTMEEKDIIQAMLSDYLKWVKK